MLCELCGDSEATVHLTQAVNEQVREMHLCQECASKSGLNIQNSMALADILLGVGSKKSGESRAASEIVCRRCQMRFADFKKTSRLGCPECYETFAVDLEALLDGMHRSRQHAGKQPSRIPAAQGVSASRMAALKQALDAAIGAEDYEEAARLRDNIRRASEPGEAEPDVGGAGSEAR